MEQTSGGRKVKQNTLHKLWKVVSIHFGQNHSKHGIPQYQQQHGLNTISSTITMDNNIGSLLGWRASGSNHCHSYGLKFVHRVVCCIVNESEIDDVIFSILVTIVFKLCLVDFDQHLLYHLLWPIYLIETLTAAITHTFSILMKLLPPSRNLCEKQFTPKFNQSSRSNNFIN